MIVKEQNCIPNCNKGQLMLLTENDFLNYFRGISIAVADNDTTAVYGLSGSAGTMVMRVHYHTTIPYPEDHYIDFTSLANNLAFNQRLTNRIRHRAGTGYDRNH